MSQGWRDELAVLDSPSIQRHQVESFRRRLRNNYLHIITKEEVEVCAVNLCGWYLNRPEVSVVTNVLRNAALAELQRR